MFVKHRRVNFRLISVQDIKLVLPQEAWRVRGRPLDMIRADLITMIGLLSVFSHLLVNTNKWLALVPAMLLTVRTYLNYRSHSSEPELEIIRIR